MTRRAALLPAHRCADVRWRRERRRAWARRNDTSGAPVLFAAIPSLPRAELARLTERMIDRMDEIDGDADLEGAYEDWEDSHDREYVQDI